MSKKKIKRVRHDDFSIPDYIGSLFGYAPTLKTEDNEIYWNCMEQFIKCVEPKDIIEWLVGQRRCGP
jgi:hypothetical protein